MSAQWFIGEKNVEKKRLVPYREIWFCPEVGCDGKMIATGATWPTTSPGFHHRCDKCGVVWVIHEGTYPRVMFEEEKTDA